MFIAIPILEDAMPDRLQQEIDDLLARLDTFPPKRSLLSRVKRGIARVPASLWQAIGGTSIPRLSAGHLLLIAIGVIVVGYLVLPEGSNLTRWIIGGAVVAFIAAFVMSLRRQSRPPSQKYWRDKPLDLRGSSRMRSWWDRRRRR